MGKQTLSTSKDRQLELQRIISEQTTQAMEQAKVENYPEAIKCLETAKQAYDKEFPQAKLSRRTSTGPLARHFGSLKSAAEGEARDTEKETTRQYEALAKLMADFQSKVDIKPADVMSPVSKQRSFSIDADHIDDQDPSLQAVRSIAVEDSSQQEESHRDDAKDPAEPIDNVVTSTSPNAEAFDEEANLEDVLFKVVEESAVLLNDNAAADAQLQKDQETARVAAEQEAARVAAEQEAARVAAEQEAARVAAEQEAARVAAEQEAARVAAEQEAARVAAEQEAARAAAEQEAARAAEQEAARAAEQEAARAAAEQEAARAAEQEAARVAAEQEAARVAAEQEAARVAAEKEAARVAAEKIGEQFAAVKDALQIPAEANDPEFQFDVEMQQLRAHQLHPDLNTHRDTLIKKIDELKASKEGMKMCPDLVEALKATNTLLTSPQPDFKAYEKVADKMQGHPSPGFYALGAIMILLGAAAALLAASGFGLIIVATAAAISAASFASAGASFFGASRKGLSSDMVHLSEKVETTVQDQPEVAAP